MIGKRWAWGVLLVAAAAPAARAQTSYPMITRVLPAAIQRGQTAEVTVAGTHSFAGASAVLIEGEGLKAEVLDSGSPAPETKGRGRGRANSTVKIKLTASADTELGPRELRIVTPQGISTIGLVVVVADPVVSETDEAANDAPARAQSLTLPVAVSGTISKTEDVDWYSFQASAGQRVTFSLWGNRLENKIHDLQTHLDPIIQVHDAQGRELATNDNYDFADPMLSYEFKDGGTYYVQVRDTTYAGNANWTYVLQVTSGPYATSVFPMAVNPGKTAALHATGYNFDASQPIRLEVPAKTPSGPRTFALPTAQGATLPFPLVVTELPIVSEESDTPADGDKAQSISLPAAVCGRLGDPNDVDGYRFEAKKDTLYAFEVIARRGGAATDPVLRILNDKGATVTEADDTFGKDPRIEWKAPADGTFSLQLNDLHNRGGETFGYVVLAEPAKPDFVVSCDPDKMSMGPGVRTPVFVKVDRRNGFTGPVAMRWEGLPQGISASPLTIPASMTQGVIVLSAEAKAEPSGALVKLLGEGKSDHGPIVRETGPIQEIYLPGGGRGLYKVETLAVGVSGPSDITVEAKPSEITLTPGQTATIDVTVTRHGGYDQPVNLAVNLAHLGRIFGTPLPPGVIVREAGSKTLLGPKDTQGKIILEAKPDAAPIDSVPITIMGHVSIDFVVKTAYCSAPIAVSIKPKGK